MKLMHRRTQGACLAVVLSVGLGAPQADEQVTIDYRQGVMKAVGGNMAALAAVLVDGADYRDNLALHARFIADALQDVPALFPEGSDFGETDALASIWEEQEKFQQRAEGSRKAAELLVEAVEKGDDAMALRFRELGESCRACHEDFRRRD